MSFSLGQTVITSGAKAALPDADVNKAMGKYISGDWGLLCAEDKKMNDEAVISGEDRIVAKYRSSAGDDFYIITEWDRSVTTVLLVSEY